MISIHYLPYLPYLCKKSIYMEATEKKERTVIHLQMGDVHEYYGSIANIITYGSLRNYGLSADKPYANNRCIIRKGVLRQKAGGRGRKMNY